MLMYWFKSSSGSHFKMTQKQKADNVLANFIQKVQSINTNQKIPKIVKEIDKLSYQCYEDLYGIIDIRKSVSNIDNTKHGHCC